MCKVKSEPHLTFFGFTCTSYVCVGVPADVDMRGQFAGVGSFPLCVQGSDSGY